jgi:hypothetical protein
MAQLTGRHISNILNKGRYYWIKKFTPTRPAVVDDKPLPVHCAR